MILLINNNLILVIEHPLHSLVLLFLLFLENRFVTDVRVGGFAAEVESAVDQVFSIHQISHALPELWIIHFGRLALQIIIYRHRTILVLKSP